MNAAFTVCTSDYIAHALALGESFLSYNPGDQFFICLPDKLGCDMGVSGINSADLKSFQFIEISQLNISVFPDMCERYNLIELCSAVKPFFARYILQKYTNCDILCYFDCDMLIFDSLTYIKDKLKVYDILLTPHILTEHPAKNRQIETRILNAGIYNAGFFGLRKSESADKMLRWWQNRVTTHGYVNFMRGMYADQLWLNFVPLFFQNVGIETHSGCNVAYWNLHERTIQPDGNLFKVNQSNTLLFFHFSGLQLNQTIFLSHYDKSIKINDNDALVLICRRYWQTWEKYQNLLTKRMPNPYIKYRPQWIEFVRGWLIVILNKSMEILGA